MDISVTLATRLFRRKQVPTISDYLVLISRDLNFVNQLGGLIEMDQMADQWVISGTHLLLVRGTELQHVFRVSWFVKRANVRPKVRYPLVCHRVHLNQPPQ